MYGRRPLLPGMTFTTAHPDALNGMRNKDDKNEFKEQQDAEIMDAYRRLFREYGGKVDVKALYSMVSAAPASRFFVSARQAYRVVLRLCNGEQITDMRLSNQRMYSEIYRRVCDMIDVSNCTASELRKAVASIVRQPAPEMYVGVRQVSYIISQEKRKCYEERKRRLRHCF